MREVGERGQEVLVLVGMRRRGKKPNPIGKAEKGIQTRVLRWGSHAV